MTLSLQINWCNYGHYKIIDVDRKRHDQVQQFMLEYFRCCEIFQVLNIQQEAGIETDFLKIVQHILENESSIIVVDNEFNNIKGVALLKCMTQEYRSWTALRLLIESERFKELCAMLCWCLQHKEKPAGDSLHIFSFHLCKELAKDQEFMATFFKAICEVARHMHMPAVTCMCLTQSEYECLQSNGFNESIRVIYSMYLINNKRPFDRLRDINEMYGVFCEKHVPALMPYQEMPIRHAEIAQDNEIQPKMSKQKI